MPSLMITRPMTSRDPKNQIRDPIIFATLYLRNGAR